MPPRKIESSSTTFPFMLRVIIVYAVAVDENQIELLVSFASLRTELMRRLKTERLIDTKNPCEFQLIVLIHIINPCYLFSEVL